MPQTDNQWPSIQPQRGPDWADELAADIIADIRSRRHKEAAELTAARLRLVMIRGEVTAAFKACEIVKQELAYGGPSQATLQREHQADVDEEREHGWAAE